VKSSVKSGNAKEALLAYERLISNENLLRKAVHAAAEPIAEAIRQNVNNVTGKTDADITVLDAPSEAGTVTVLIGATGGKGGRGFILNFLEHGTSKMRARPCVRPALDSEGDAIGERMAEVLRPVLEGGA